MAGRFRFNKRSYATNCYKSLTWGGYDHGSGGWVCMTLHSGEKVYEEVASRDAALKRWNAIIDETSE